VNDLLGSIGPVVEALGRSAHPQAPYLQVRLVTSARNVVAAQLGAYLYEQPATVPTDSASTQTAAMMLVFGCGQASIDLCASCLMRWKHQVRSDGEWDFGQLRNWVTKNRHRLSVAEASWFDAVDGSAEGKELEDFRHAVIHRVVRQDVNVGGYPLTTIAASTAAPGTDDTRAVLGRTVRFVEARWRDFWPALQVT
jgi:hypothetical protein